MILKGGLVGLFLFGVALPALFSVDTEWGRVLISDLI